MAIEKMFGACLLLLAPKIFFKFYGNFEVKDKGKLNRIIKKPPNHTFSFFEN